MSQLDFNEKVKTEIDSVVKRIYESIQKSNLSYGELAQITGIAKSALHRYATGQTQKIPIEAVRLIANATGVSTAYLMGWDEESETEHHKEVTDNEIKIALFGGEDDVSDEMLNEVKRYAKYIQDREKNNK